MHVTEESAVRALVLYFVAVPASLVSPVFCSPCQVPRHIGETFEYAKPIEVLKDYSPIWYHLEF